MLPQPKRAALRLIGLLLCAALLGGLLSGCLSAAAQTQSTDPAAAQPAAAGGDAADPARTQTDRESQLEITPEMAKAFQNGIISVEDTALPPIRLDLCAIGDVMAHEGTYKAAQTGKNYDFTAMFTEIAPYVGDTDYLVGNLETTFAGAKRGYAGYPCFNTPEQMADALKTILGMDLLSTANNHSLDTGFAGLSSTLDFLDAAGIAHTGTYRGKEESGKPFIAEIKGAKIAFLSYTYGSNNPVPSARSWCLNITDREAIRAEAQAAYDAGADYIIALLHWGAEYRQEASAQQRSLAEWIFAETKVQMIIGNHAHVVAPIEELTVRQDGREKKGLVFYALGNFTGAQRNPYTDTGIIAHIGLVIDRARPEDSRVEYVKYIPTYIDPNELGTGKRYRVVAISKAMSDYENGADPLISAEDYRKISGYRADYAQALEVLPVVAAAP